MKKAIILAGGQGTRLRPVTLEIPKPLVTVNRKPIINYLIGLFHKHGVEEAAIVIRPKDREEFEWWHKRWLKDLGGVKINFFEEPRPRGTIGHWARELRHWTGDEPFFYTNGDELKDVDLGAMEKKHKTNGELATIALVAVPNPHEYGVAVLEGDKIRHFLEKPKNPPTNLISSGLYILEPDIFKYLENRVKSNEEFLMVEKDLFPHLAKDGKLTAFKSSGRWYDCGTLERWEEAIKEWDKS